MVPWRRILSLVIVPACCIIVAAPVASRGNGHVVVVPPTIVRPSIVIRSWCIVVPSRFPSPTVHVPPSHLPSYAHVLAGRGIVGSLGTGKVDANVPAVQEDAVAFFKGTLGIRLGLKVDEGKATTLLGARVVDELDT